MTIEQLKELRLRLDLSTVCSEQGLTISEKYDLIAILDAEISRQQTTSEDVQKAIEWFSDRSSVAVYMNGEVQPNFRKVHQDVLHTIDAALQQYTPKEPPEGDYESAIEGIICVRAGRECQKKWATKDWDKTKWQRVIDECNLAIQCLEYCRDLKAGE